ncbi:hypothetical protein OEZ85_010380 [Tetradesmus obliquus]|uniref:SWIM-type domain-containing protein n=1 Tax=Tetradesmus obliquus TaxID=3088 RepID=A0ABY8TPF3_TETOB|nr:hypothetical protein OEZ85_010380 [Tetradesmus obliquus]
MRRNMTYLQQSENWLQQQDSALGRGAAAEEAVVEFEHAAGAAAALAARQQVSIFSGRNGQRSSAVQLVLPAAGIGHLKQPCTCRMYKRPCTCPGYVKVAPNRPTRHQSYHRGGAGQHVLSATRL